MTTLIRDRGILGEQYVCHEGVIQLVHDIGHRVEVGTTIANYSDLVCHPLLSSVFLFVVSLGQDHLSEHSRPISPLLSTYTTG